MGKFAQETVNLKCCSASYCICNIIILFMVMRVCEFHVFNHVYTCKCIYESVNFKYACDCAYEGV